MLALFVPLHLSQRALPRRLCLRLRPLDLLRLEPVLLQFAPLLRLHVPLAVVLPRHHPRQRFIVRHLQPGHLPREPLVVGVLLRQQVVDIWLHDLQPVLVLRDPWLELLRLPRILLLGALLHPLLRLRHALLQQLRVPRLRARLPAP